MAHGVSIALVTTMIIITVQHFLLASRQPEKTRMDMIGRANTNYLRSHGDKFLAANSPIHGPTEDFFSTNTFAKDNRHDLISSMWHDEFFSPLLDCPLMQELRRQEHNMMMMDPAFKLDENGDQVSLIMSIPDVPLGDIEIEIIGGRVVHIKGEKTTDSSHVSFDKRFSIGQHLNESSLEAKLTKDGDLIVTAPKVGTEEKEEVRKIDIKEEL